MSLNQAERNSPWGWCMRHLLFATGWCIVIFSAMNIIGELFRPGFDANILCLPVAPTAWWASRLLVGAATVFLGISLARTLRRGCGDMTALQSKTDRVPRQPLRKGWVYWSTQGLLAFMILNALAAALGTRWQFFSNEISQVLPARYTVCVAAAIGSQIARVWLEQRHAVTVHPVNFNASISPDWVAPSNSFEGVFGESLVVPPPPNEFGCATRRERLRNSSLSRRISAWGTIGGVCVVIVAFLGAQFFLFGGARRDVWADCAVVMGAGVHFDGSPTKPLAERTLAACNLYLSGQVQYLIMSGGLVYRSFTEPMSMRAFAVKHGVPRRAIVLDEKGYSTFDTARNARRIMAEKGWRKAVVVTHDYHLSRAWLTFRRAGINTVTYPAQRDGFHLSSDTRVIFRECAAWWYYFLRPLCGRDGREDF